MDGREVGSKSENAKRGNDDEDESESKEIDSELESTRSSAWMELNWPDGGNPSFIVRMRPANKDLDVGLSSCTASLRGDGSARVALTDASGCALSGALPYGLEQRREPQSGVKIVEGVLRLPRIKGSGEMDSSSAGRARLSARCELRVCQSSCGVCEDDRGASDAPDNAIVDVFTVAAHLDLNAEVTHEGADEEKEDLEEQAGPAMSSTTSDNARVSMLVEGQPLAVEERRRRPMTTASSARSVSEATSAAAVAAAPSSESVAGLLCVSPAKMAVAFTVLLLVLLFALGFACALWLRARVGLAGKLAGMPSSGNGGSSGNPRASHAPPPPALSIQHHPTMRRMQPPPPPMLVQRGQPHHPYVRVMH